MDLDNELESFMNVVEIENQNQAKKENFMEEEKDQPAQSNNDNVDFL